MPAPRKIPATAMPGLREWYKRWIEIPRPGQVAKFMGVSKSTLILACKQFRYKDIR